MKDDITPKRKRPTGRTYAHEPEQGDSRDSHALRDDPIETVEDAISPPPEALHGKRAKNYLGKIKQLWQSKPRKQKIIIGGAIGLGLLLSIGGLTYALWPRSDPTPEPVEVAQEVAEEPEPPEPITVPSPLTGLDVDPELAELPVTGVIIENSPEARPQSGLGEAGVVFESMVEGSITRFLALYQEQQPENLGPIRSVRRNHIDWILGFDAAIAHVGGSGVALSRIKNEGVKDLDQFQNSEAYARSNARYAPHNMYSNRANLLQVHEKRGYTSSDYQSLVRKAPEPKETPDVTKIDMSISSPLYNPSFIYDSDTNSYKRLLAGVPHIDELSNKQIQSDVVIALVANYRRDGIYSVYDTIGSNTAYIFQDGSVTKGIWEKPTKKDNYRFGDVNGLPIGINPGKTWIVLVRQESEVRY